MKISPEHLPASFLSNYWACLCSALWETAVSFSLAVPARLGWEDVGRDNQTKKSLKIQVIYSSSQVSFLFSLSPQGTLEWIPYQSAEGLRVSREGGHVEEQKERGPACRGEGLLPMEVSPRDGFLALLAFGCCEGLRHQYTWKLSPKVVCLLQNNFEKTLKMGAGVSVSSL